MAVRDASPAVIVLMSIAAVATWHSVRCDCRAERLARRMLHHVRQYSPDALDALPSFYRRHARATVQVRILRRTRIAVLGPDDLDELRRLERHHLAGVAVTLACIGILLLGSSLFQWRWG